MSIGQDKFSEKVEIPKNVINTSVDRSFRKLHESLMNEITKGQLSSYINTILTMDIRLYY